MSDETAIEVEQEQEQQAPERPEWLPENFKDEAAFAASYKEAERKIREQGEKLRELEQQNEEWQDWAQQQHRPAATDPAQQIAEIWDDPDRQPMLILEMAQRLAQMEQQVAQASQRGPDPALTQITADYAENRMRAQHDDWDTYRNQIAELVQQNPHLLGTDAGNLEQVASGLDLAYRAVKGHVLSTTAGQAANDAAEAARLAKEQAQTMSGASSRPATQTANEEYWAAVRAAASGSYSDS